MRYFIILFTLISIVSNGQEVTLISTLTNTPIDGVSIFGKSNKIGIISNKKGIVNLNKYKATDTLIIQHIAYNTLILTKKEVINKTIYLDLKSHTLNNITIRENKELLFDEEQILTSANTLKIMETQAAQTSEVLTQTMGLSIQNSQNGGGSPNLRGMEANRLLLVIDGIPINNTISRGGHLQNSATINPLYLESIKASFGPASVAYGSGAMGGALLFNTRSPKDTNSNQFIQQFESSSKAVFTSLISNYKIKNGSFLSGFSIKSFGNLKMGNNRMHGHNDWGNEPTIVENNIQLETGYQQADFFHKSLFKLSNNSFLLLNTQYATSSNINRFDKLNDIKNGERKYKEWYYGPQNKFLQSIRLKNYTSHFFSDESVLTLAYQNIKESRHKQKANEELLNNRSELLNIADLKLDFLKSLYATKLNYGIDLRLQNLESTANLSNTTTLYHNTTRYPNDGTKTLNFAVYYQAYFPFKKHFKIKVGSRYNRNQLAANFEDNSTIQLPYSTISTSNQSLSNSLQVLYTRNKISFNAIISNGFRNPNTDDIGKIFSKDDASVILPNELLKPERSTNFEAGTKINFTNGSQIQFQIFQTHLLDAIEKAEATLNGKDSIMYDGKLMRVMMNTNIKEATLNGFNISYFIKFNQKISNTTLLNSVIGETNNNTPLAHIPPTSINTSLNYKVRKHHKISLSINYNAAKKTKDYDLNDVDNLDEATNEGNPSWYTINVKYSGKIDKNIYLIFGIQNILDTHYKTFGSGISASGRNITLSLHTNF